MSFMRRSSPIRTLVPGLTALLLCACTDPSVINERLPYSADTSGIVTSDGCIYDPDQPTACPVWNCDIASGEFGQVMRCQTEEPEGAIPADTYECPESGGGVLCPGQTAGGSGAWQCKSEITGLICNRPMSGLGPSAGPGRKIDGTP